MKLRSREIKKKNDEKLKKKKPLNRIPKVQNRTEFDEKFTNFDQPGAYSRKILHYIKNKEKELRKNKVYSLHGPRRKKFPRRKLIVYYPGTVYIY